MRRRGLGTALVAAGAVAIGLTLLAWAVGATNGPERSAVDARFSVRGTQSPPRDVAVVGIDHRTTQKLGPFPFKRTVDAAMIRRLLRDGARVVAFDAQFTEPTTSKADASLMQSVFDAHGKVVLNTNAPRVDPGHRGQTDVFGGTQIPGMRVGNNGTDPDADGVVRRFHYATSGLRDYRRRSRPGRWAPRLAQRVRQGGCLDRLPRAEGDRADGFVRRRAGRPQGQPAARACGLRGRDRSDRTGRPSDADLAGHAWRGDPGDEGGDADR